MHKLKWGILSTAKIAREKVIPAMQKSQGCEVIAIASREPGKATETATKLGIAKSYGSYEELLADKEIDAVYIPLPNHKHVEWAIRSLEAGKHVLCEKPIGLTSAEGQLLVNAGKKHPHLKIMEAFMYRFHPQWQHAKKLVEEGSIGELKTIQSFFSYYNVDPKNIRNQKDAGGGGLLDIGCYCISLSRFITGAEPARVFGNVEMDPVMQTDRLASGILDFEKVSSSFTCSTQLFPYQRVNILGTEGRIEIEIPFNAPPDADTIMWHHSKAGAGKVLFTPVDQYTLQAEKFSRAVIEDTPVPFGLDDAVNNMKVIEAIFKSSKDGGWVSL